MLEILRTVRLHATRARSLLAALLFVAAVAAPPAAHAATIVVDSLADSDVADAVCSLREAIVAANGDAAYQGCAAGSGADRIEFAVTGSIVLASDLPVIDKTVSLEGPRAVPPDVTIDGNNHRLLVMNGSPNGRTLTLRYLTLRDGFNSDVGGCVTVRTGDHLEMYDSRVLSCESLASGGGLYGDGAASFTIVRSIIRNNIGASAGGFYFLGEGYPTLLSGDPGPHGPVPTASFSMEDSTVSGNQTSGETGGGGVVLGWANGEIRRSTVSGNLAGDAGGGVLQIYGSLLFDGLTITNNTADTNADDVGELGAGLYVVGDATYPATLFLHNSVVGNNFAAATPSDVYVSLGAAILSQGFNLIGVRDGAAAFFPLGAPNAFDDWVGSRSSPVLAGLAALAANGGPTETHAPSPGSLLVDHGDCPDDLRDQRGYGDAANDRRPVDNALIPDSSDGCDIGAFEADGVELPGILFLDGFESGDESAWSSTSP